jgi:hypothetical protein
MSDYLLNYYDRIKANGETIGDAQFNATAQFIESTFPDSPFYTIAKINNEDVGVRIVDLPPITRGNLSLQHTRKIMQFKPSANYDIGTVAVVDGENWLLTDFNGNKLYPQARIDRCNSSITINTPTEQVIGENPYTHEPIIDLVAGTDVIYPCVVEQALTNETLGQAINLDRDTVLVTLPYFDFKENNFEVFGEKYAVKSIDKTRSINGKGLLKLLGERSV